MKGKIRKKYVLIAAAASFAVIAAAAATTALAGTMTADEAKALAKTYVTEKAELLACEEENTKYEIAYRDASRKETFEVEVNKDTQKVKKVEMQIDNDQGSKDVKLAKTDVEKIVQKSFPGVTSIDINLEKEHGLYEYEVNFKANDFYGSAEIDPSSGTILESTVKYGTATVIPGESKDMLTSAEAEQAAVKKAGGGTVDDIDLEEENGKYYYEVELVKDNKEYDYIVDAATGEATLDGSHDQYIGSDDDEEDAAASNSGSSSISVSEAKAIVLRKIPGASISHISLDKEDGIYVYEGEAVRGNNEYDFAVNASSGVIIEWDKEAVDTNDNSDDESADDEDENESGHDADDNGSDHDDDDSGDESEEAED